MGRKRRSYDMPPAWESLDKIAQREREREKTLANHNIPQVHEQTREKNLANLLQLEEKPDYRGLGIWGVWTLLVYRLPQQALKECIAATYPLYPDFLQREGILDISSLSAITKEFFTEIVNLSKEMAAHQVLLTIIVADDQPIKTPTTLHAINQAGGKIFTRTESHQRHRTIGLMRGHRSRRLAKMKTNT